MNVNVQQKLCSQEGYERVTGAFQGSLQELNSWDWRSEA